MTYKQELLQLAVVSRICGNRKKSCYVNTQNFAEISPNLPFTEFDFYDLYRSTFEKSELGRIKALLPLREMAENFGLTTGSIRPRCGREPYFTPEVKVVLI